MAFVQDFLVPSVVRNMGFPGVMGAYILDSVMAFNDTADSQVKLFTWSSRLDFLH